MFSLFLGIVIPLLHFVAFTLFKCICFQSALIDWQWLPNIVENYLAKFCLNWKLTMWCKLNIKTWHFHQFTKEYWKYLDVLAVYAESTISNWEPFSLLKKSVSLVSLSCENEMEAGKRSHFLVSPYRAHTIWCRCWRMQPCPLSPTPFSARTVHTVRLPIFSQVLHEFLFLVHLSNSQYG